MFVLPPWSDNEYEELKAFWAGRCDESGVEDSIVDSIAVLCGIVFCLMSFACVI